MIYYLHLTYSEFLQADLVLFTGMYRKLRPRSETKPARAFF